METVTVTSQDFVLWVRKTLLALFQLLPTPKGRTQGAQTALYATGPWRAVFLVCSYKPYHSKPPSIPATPAHTLQAPILLTQHESQTAAPTDLPMHPPLLPHLGGSFPRHQPGHVPVAVIPSEAVPISPVEGDPALFSSLDNISPRD